MNTLRTAIPTWVRVVLGLGAAIHLATGAWAVLAPANWFDRFPGFGEPLVAADPPFNAHLASDTGAGFIAIGVLLLLAAILGDRLVALVACAVLFVYSAPHLVFHALHPAANASTYGIVAGLVSIALAVLLPIVLVLSITLTKGD